MEKWKKPSKIAQVKITEPARFDLEEIWRYIAEDNAKADDKFMDELGNKFLLLAGKPDLGRERHELMLNLRAFPHKKFMIFYYPTDEGIEIFRSPRFTRYSGMCKK